MGFLDFDVEIVRREGMPITEIFARRGEPVFRELERALTEEVAVLPAMVLAVPVGAGCNRPERMPSDLDSALPIKCHRKPLFAAASDFITRRFFTARTAAAT